MTKSAQDVLQLAMELGPVERAMVVECLLGTLHPPGRSFEEPEYRKEIERRTTELATGAVVGLSWDEVLADVRAGLKRGR